MICLNKYLNEIIYEYICIEEKFCKNCFLLMSQIVRRERERHERNISHKVLVAADDKDYTVLSQDYEKHYL